MYQDLLIEIPKLDEDLLAILPFYTSFLGELGSGKRDYLETQSLQSSITGSFGAYAIKRSMVDDADTMKTYFVLSGKALLRNHEAMLGLMTETLDDVRFDEHSRIRELFAQTRAAREQSVTGSGHALAMSAAASGINPIAALSHRLHGLQGIKSLKALDDGLDNEAGIREVAERFERLHNIIRQGQRQHLIVAEEENIQSLSDRTSDLYSKSETANTPATPFTVDFQPDKVRPVSYTHLTLPTTLRV